jgi:hypothetical protein
LELLDQDTSTALAADLLTESAFGAGGAALKTEQQLSNPFDFNFNLV